MKPYATPCNLFRNPYLYIFINKIDIYIEKGNAIRVSIYICETLSGSI